MRPLRALLLRDSIRPQGLSYGLDVLKKALRALGRPRGVLGGPGEGQGGRPGGPADLKTARGLNQY